MDKEIIAQEEALEANEVAGADLQHDLDFLKDDASISTFQRYLNEIHAIPPLSQEEKDTLPSLIARGLAAEKSYRAKEKALALTREDASSLQATIDAGTDAYDRYVNANLGLVVYFAYRKRGLGVDIEDLIQEGALGLGRAVLLFDPSKGYQFSTYANWWIRQAIDRAIANQGRTIRLPKQKLDDIKKLYAVRGRLEATTGTAPSDEALAHELGWKVSRIAELEELSVQTGRLDELVKGSENTSRIELLTPDLEDVDVPSPTGEEALIDREEKRELRRKIASLPDKERQVIALRFGFVDMQTHTFEEIGARMGFSKERANQYYQSALKKLRS